LHRLSKIDTLRLAIAYIALLKEILVSEYDPITYIEKCLRGEIKGEHTADRITSGEFVGSNWFTSLICLENRFDGQAFVDQVVELGGEYQPAKSDGRLFSIRPHPSQHYVFG